ncbi:hypothetical protein SJ093_18040 [Citrobacter freundii]|nr:MULTISPECIES: hypothetical protein [Citrobacter]MDN4198129.1 hypothetical protein [Citrobacter freundii]MDN4228713.1 hypothetical protein [Citrobacter freundii]MDN4295522.1 hypothetical protein [Citrobacter freundii]MDN4360671.1 hypothetical protein [Citrobacter portucalensis]MDN4365290.1 hypothetical protein [Citrobacter portucalensis]
MSQSHINQLALQMASGEKTTIPAMKMKDFKVLLWRIEYFQRRAQ